MAENIVSKMMERAFELALNGGVAVSPNPMVGAVIFDDDGNIAAEGWHKKYGGPHAEPDALAKLDFNAKGLNMAVTLEPCNHTGKTPPCSHAILKSGIKKVYIACNDTNGKASGGAEFLNQNGVEAVFLSEFTEKAREINRFFFKQIETGKPWVTLKMAKTIDGFIALSDGSSKYISGNDSLRKVHELRASHAGIAVGSGTVNMDNPSLDVRFVTGTSPRPIIFSAKFNLSQDSKVFAKNPIIVTAADYIPEWADKIDIIKIKNKENLISESLQLIAKDFGINSILLEGGSKLAGDFYKAGEIDELVFFTAPFFMMKGLSPLEGDCLKDLNKKVTFTLKDVQRFGDDVMTIYRKK